MQKLFKNTRGVLLAVMVLTLSAGVAMAGCGACGGGAGHSHDSHAGHDHAKTDAAQMEMMKSMFASCDVCKNMVPYMDDLMPIMDMELVTLNDGFAIVHSVTDASKLGQFREMSAKMYAAGEACMAKDGGELCHFCAGAQGVVQAGGSMSHGDTKMGDIMVLTSSDAKVQAKIAALREQMEMQMAASH